MIRYLMGEKRIMEWSVTDEGEAAQSVSATYTIYKDGVSVKTGNVDVAGKILSVEWQPTQKGGYQIEITIDVGTTVRKIRDYIIVE